MSFGRATSTVTDRRYNIFWGKLWRLGRQSSAGRTFASREFPVRAESRASMSPTRIDVNLGPRSYPILIGSGMLAELGKIVRAHGLRQADAFVITNPQVGALYF